MYFAVEDIEFEMLDDYGNPRELTDDELQRIGDYICRTVWECPGVNDLAEKIEKSLNCRIESMKFDVSPVIPT